MIDEAEAALVAAVESREAPLDVYADWLEERGDERAVGMRWLAEHDRMPRFDCLRVWERTQSVELWSWQWHVAAVLYMRNQLPREPLYESFRLKFRGPSTFVLEFDSFAEALDVAARAVGEAIVGGRLRSA